ncbi:vioD [Scenedesmus sp. PABB004]|nr:vioD [Scenedesmus sp. PABB004]
MALPGGGAPRAPRPFKLERFFAKYEFAAPHLMCCSDCEPLPMAELLAAADADSLARWSSLRLAYTESQGLPALREAIAGLYEGVLPEQVVVCVPEEGIYLTMRALLRPGDEIVAPSPCYQSLHELAEAAGCTLSEWTPRAAGGPGGGGRLEFAVSDVLPLITRRTRLVVANFPHNPSGATLPAEDWAALVAACRAAGCWLMSDEMYRGLEAPPAAPLPSGVEYERGIVLGGLSKAWGLPGLRLGWLVSQDAAVLQDVLTYKDYTTICSPAPSEVLALAAVRATPALQARCRRIIAANSEAAEPFFARWRDVFDWAPPQAGPIAFPRLATGEDAEAWCDTLVREAGVLLLPAAAYENCPPAARDRVRVGLGRADFPACLAALEPWLQKRYRSGGGGGP